MAVAAEIHLGADRPAPPHRMDAAPADADTVAPVHDPGLALPVLEGLRTRGWWRLRFPPPLEAGYARARMDARLGGVDICNIVGSAMFWATTAGDAEHAPQQASTVAMLQYGVTGYLVASTLFGMWRGRRRKTWEPDAAVTLSLVAITLYTWAICHLACTPLNAITASGLLLVIMHSTIVVRQEFRHALGVVAWTAIGYGLMSAHAVGLTRVIVDGNLRLLCTAGAFSLVANYLLELRQRRTHLLHLCAAAHQAALARGMQALHRQSHCDPLTGIANRRRFDALLEKAWLGADQIGLLVLDIDHFKRYNDHYGHPAGDVCLRAVAGAIDTAAQSHGGAAARIGGEEFAVLLPGLGPDANGSAAAAADAVCAAVRRLAIGHARSSTASVVTVSVGVAVMRPARGDGIASLLAAADAALYSAKDAGRNRWATAPSSGEPAAATTTTTTTTTATTPAPAPTSDSTSTNDDRPGGVRLERLQQALRRSGWRLRFEPDLEAEYDQSRRRGRGARLCLLGVAGLLFSVAYVRYSTAMFSNHAALMLDMVETLAFRIELPLLLLLLLPMTSWLRESICALCALVLSVSVPLLTGAYPSMPLQSYVLAMFLPPMFNAVIAEQPFRHCVAPFIATMLVCATLMFPGLGRGDLTTAWMLCTGITVFATIYSLTASHLLERSNRRIYLLTQLDQANSDALEQQTEHLRHLATVDPTTGIANRRGHDAEQARCWAACIAHRQGLALLLLDVDHFKRYNDLYGHPAGDACLRHVAQALERWSRTVAARGGVAPWPARLGGEEFGVLLPGCNAADALSHGRSLCAAVAALGIPHAGSPTAKHLTVSIGAAAVAPFDAERAAGPGVLLAAADAALYRAKAAGRARAGL